MKGYIYIALPTDGNMNSIKIGYTTNSLRERMQKGAKSRKFSIVAAVGVNDEDYFIKDMTVLLQAVESMVHYKATDSGLLRMVSHDWMQCTEEAWASIEEMLEGRILEGLIYKAFEIVDIRVSKYLATITL